MNKFEDTFTSIINETTIIKAEEKPDLEDVIEQEYDSNLVTKEQLDNLKNKLQEILATNRRDMSTVKKYAKLKSDIKAWQTYGFYTGQNSIIKLIFKELGLNGIGIKEE